MVRALDNGRRWRLSGPVPRYPKQNDCCDQRETAHEHPEPSFEGVELLIDRVDVAVKTRNFTEVGGCID